MATKTSPARNACVMMMRAALILSSESLMLATTEAPMPSISPMPVVMRKSGATILTAAMPLAPTPWPTNMPSTSVSTELKIMPTSVGKKSALNRTPILPEPKSSRSRSRFFTIAAAKVALLFIASTVRRETITAFL